VGVIVLFARSSKYMTNQTEQTDRTPAPEPVEEPKYQIDAKAFESSGRSFGYSVYTRLSQNGKAVVDDGKTAGGFGPAAEYMKVMSNICSK